MGAEKYLATLEAKNGALEIWISKDENGNYKLWEKSRRNIRPPGNIHKLLGEYQDLQTARAEAELIISRYEQYGEEG